MIAVLCASALAFDVGVGIRGDNADQVELSQFELTAAQPLHPWVRATAGLWARALPPKGPVLSEPETMLRDDDPVGVTTEMAGALLGLAVAPPWDPDRPADRVGVRPMVFVGGGAAYTLVYEYFLGSPSGRSGQFSAVRPMGQAGIGGEVALDPGLSVQATFGAAVRPNDDLHAVWTIDVIGRIPSR